jgi:hypothetical protein
MKFVKSICMAAGFPCQNYREGENLLCATFGDHIDFHANGYWLDGKFELIVLPFVSSVGVVAPTLPTPILPTPVLKARINESSLPRQSAIAYLAMVLKLLQVLRFVLLLRPRLSLGRQSQL